MKPQREHASTPVRQHARISALLSGGGGESRQGRRPKRKTFLLLLAAQGGGCTERLLLAFDVLRDVWRPSFPCTALVPRLSVPVSVPEMPHSTKIVCRACLCRPVKTASVHYAFSEGRATDH